MRGGAVERGGSEALDLGEEKLLLVLRSTIRRKVRSQRPIDGCKSNAAARVAYVELLICGEERPESEQNDQSATQQAAESAKQNIGLTFPVVVEVFEKLDQLNLVPPQDCLDLRRLLRVRHKHLQKTQSRDQPDFASPSAPHHHMTYLEDVERLKLNILALVLQ